MILESFLNFSSNASDVFLLHKNSNFVTKGKVDIILSPELYWCKTFSIPITNPKEIKLLLPTYFEDYIEDTTFCSYYFIPLDEPKMYLCFAYKQETIVKAITESGLQLSQVNKIYFAQNEFKDFDTTEQSKLSSNQEDSPPVALQSTPNEIDETNEATTTDETPITNEEDKENTSKEALSLDADDVNKQDDNDKKSSLQEDDNNSQEQSTKDPQPATTHKNENEIDSNSNTYSTLPGLSNIFSLGGKYFAYQQAYLTQIPKSLCANLKVVEVDIRVISLSKHFIHITYDAKYVSMLSLVVLYIILFFASVINYAKAYELFVLNQKLITQMQTIKKNAKIPKTFLETRAAIKKYEKYEKKYKKTREVLASIVNFKDYFNGSLKYVSLKQNAIVCVFDKGRLSAIKDYFSQKHRISISRDEKNIITVKFNLK